MKITITARELLDKCIWIEACDMIGLNSWAIAEGLMDDTEEIVLTLDQALKLRLIPKEDQYAS